MNQTTADIPASSQSNAPHASELPERNWVRIDTLAGLLLQTGLAVQIAALTFSKDFHGLVKIWLYGAAGFAFMATLLAVLSLGVESSPNIKRNPLWRFYACCAERLHRAAPESSHDVKYGYATVGLFFLLIAVEGGTLFTLVTLGSS